MLLTNYVLVKLSGPLIYGSYTYIFAIVTFMAGISDFGMDGLLVRLTAEYKQLRQTEKLKGLLFFVFGASCLLSFIAVGIGWMLSHTSVIKENNTRLFRVSLLALPFFTLIILGQAALLGAKKMVKGQVPEKIIKPLVLLTSFLVLVMVFKTKVSLALLVWLNVSAIIVSCLLCVQWNIFFFKDILHKVKPQWQLKTWSRMVFSFSVLNLLYQLNARIDIILLGALKGNYEVALYNIASRLPELIGFPLMVINFVINPVISEMHASRKLTGLQQVVTKSARVTAALSLPLALLLILFRVQLLAFFGQDFVKGGTAMIILCFAQVISVLFGSVNNLLIMTGNQRYAIISFAISIIISIGLKLVMIPAYGINGTAWSTAASILVWNSIMYIFVVKKVKIQPAIF